jgi:excisionase family DNA binding protein
MPIPDTDPRLLLPIADAAKLIAHSVDHVRELIKSGEILAFRRGTRIYIKRSDLEAFIDGLPPVQRYESLAAYRGRKPEPVPYEPVNGTVTDLAPHDPPTPTPTPVPLASSKAKTVAGGRGATGVAADRPRRVETVGSAYRGRPQFNLPGKGV